MDISSLRHRLREAPFKFLTAVSSASALHSFNAEWLSLQEDVDRASQLSLLTKEDTSLVYATASEVAAWGESILKVDDEAARRTILLMDEMEGIFAGLALSDVERFPPYAYSQLPSSRDSILSSSFSRPSYIPAAYSWILQNIHDPYPSSKVKEHISHDAGRPLRVITDWFKDVRRHIGWVSICKDHFKGSRALAVQAAKHLYLQTTSVSPPLPPRIVSQFEGIRTRLRDMYPMADDNGDLSDSTDDSYTLSSRRVTAGRPRSTSSTPSLVFSTDDEDSHSLASFTLDDPSVSLGKRTSSIEEDEFRPLKRNRFGFISVTDSVSQDIGVSPGTSITSCAAPSSLSLPQPTPSRKRRLSAAATERECATPPPSQCGPRPSSRLPKRRLSVSDSQPSPKRPCLPSAVGPRKQAVSTPIPIAHQTMPASDEWFPFELSDTSFSVELFNWDVVAENDVFLYNSLFDNILQSDGQDLSNVTPLSDAYQSPTPLDLGVSSVVDPSVLDISPAFTEPPPTQVTALISTPPGPITATTTPVFDFLDAFLSAINTDPAKSHTTPSSSSPSTELSLNDTIDLFGESAVMP